VAQKVEAGTSVHGTLDGLQPIDLSFDRTGAPGQCQGSMYGIVILRFCQISGQLAESVTSG
jgi:hypothetical protein